MKFSIAVNMTRRQPDVSMETVAAEVLEMVTTAEHLGFDIAWAAEHHSIEYTIAPNPLVLIVHWAAHTRTIRLGTAVITAPYWNPPCGRPGRLRSPISLPADASKSASGVARISTSSIGWRAAWPRSEAAIISVS